MEIQPPFFPITYSIAFTKNLYRSNQDQAQYLKSRYKNARLSAFRINNYAIRTNTFVISQSLFPQKKSRNKSTPKIRKANRGNASLPSQIWSNVKPRSSSQWAHSDVFQTLFKFSFSIKTPNLSLDHNYHNGVQLHQAP